MNNNVEKALHAVRKNGKWYITGGGSIGTPSVVTVNASQIGELDFSKYPAGTLIIGYEDVNEEDIEEVMEQ